MNLSNIKSHLEFATNIAVLLASAVVIAFFATAYFTPQNAQHRQIRPQKEQVLPAIAGINYNGSPRTLLIAMNTHCKFCIASVPFYNRLVEELRKSGKAVHTVGVFPNPKEDVEKYVKEKHLNIETVAGGDLNSLGLINTPTMVFLDNNGKILSSWIGQLTPKGEKNVLDIINSSE